MCRPFSKEHKLIMHRPIYVLSLTLYIYIIQKAESTYSFSFILCTYPGQFYGSTFDFQKLMYVKFGVSYTKPPGL